MWVSNLSCTRHSFYGCLLPGVWSGQHEPKRMSSDYKDLRSLYTVYQTVCLFDNYCRSCLGSAADYVKYLHSGTSDCLLSESDDARVLRKQLTWVGEMNSMLEDTEVLAARQWQDVMSSSSDGAADAEKSSLEHFDK